VFYNSVITDIMKLYPWQFTLFRTPSSSWNPTLQNQHTYEC